MIDLDRAGPFSIGEKPAHEETAILVSNRDRTREFRIDVGRGDPELTVRIDFTIGADPRCRAELVVSLTPEGANSRRCFDCEEGRIGDSAHQGHFLPTDEFAGCGCAPIWHDQETRSDGEKRR